MGSRGEAVILDVDGTLFKPYRRRARIYEILRGRYPLPAIPRSMAEPAYSLLKLVPHLVKGTPLAAQFTPALLDRVKREYYALFLSNDFLQEDEVYPGAPAFVHGLRARGYHVYYVTGRHHESPKRSMRAGTIAALEAGGFPVPTGDAVRLIMKPALARPDVEFKRVLFQGWAAAGNASVALGVDNDARACHALREAFPSALVVRFDSPQATRAAFDGPVLASWR